MSSSGLFLHLEKIPPKGTGITLSLELPEITRRVQLGRTVVFVEKTGVGVKFPKYRLVDRNLLVKFAEKIAEISPG